ncbi:MAG: HNH endonuclease [Flavobacteriaceae bacterium]|nr:HNH endonuclease [Pseudoalteromonas sp.]MCP4483978.1 HNH endonuclease [Flavobacteriaceae bacterium]
MDITKENINEHFSFNVSGEVRKKSKLARWDGKKVESKNAHGYIRAKLNGKTYYAHRLVFLHYHGYLPKIVDHFDQDKSNNAISNLVPSDYQHNARNAKLYSTNTSGAVGVGFDESRQKWKASIMVNQKTKNLGYFADKGKAITARKKAEHKYGFAKLHGAN